MLKSEIAQKRLQQWQVDPEDRFLDDIAKAPKALRPIAYGLLECDENGQAIEDLRNWEEKNRRKEMAVASLDALSGKEREKLLRIFFGACAPHVEAAWQFLKTAPYQRDYLRKAFHVPNNPEATLAGRLGWLTGMIELCANFQTDVLSPAWLAAWAPHLQRFYWSSDDVVGRLLAAVIASGGPDGEEAFTILCQSARNEHEIGGMGRHVTRGLLLAPRPEGWELMAKMLLAAQRQEGLRQTILETVDEAHPQAFRRMLALIRDHKLARFSSVVRAVDVWFGLNWESAQIKAVNDAITQTLEFLDSPSARDRALAEGDPEEVYLALWSIAFHDALEAIPAAGRLLKHKLTENRFVAVLLLGMLGLKQTRPLLLEALDDPDVRIAWRALTSGLISYGADNQQDDDLFERLQRLFERLPEKPQTQKPLLWPWTECKVDRAFVAGQMVAALGKRPPTVLISYLSALDPWNRRGAVELLSRQKKWDTLTRSTLLDLAGDSSADVRGAAFKALEPVKLKAEEIQRLEAYLTRKAADLRQGIVRLLLRQTDKEALASADRLLAAGIGNQRLAGLELLRELATAKRDEASCHRRAADYQQQRKKLSRDETTQITGILESSREQLTLANALGLMDPAERTPVVAPKRRKVQFVTPAAIACLKALDDLVHEHRETAITIETYQGQREELLGNMQWGFPYPNWQKSPEENANDWPLRDIWHAWHKNRPKAQRDADGLELVRAYIFESYCDEWDWRDLNDWARGSRERKAVVQEVTGGNERLKLRYANVVKSVLHWFLYLEPAEDEDFLLDAVETIFSLIPENENNKLVRSGKDTGSERGWDSWSDDWRHGQLLEVWLQGLVAESRKPDSKLTRAQLCRLWQLMHWRDEPVPGAIRFRPDFDLIVTALGHGAATPADLLDHLLGPRPDDNGYYGNARFDSLSRFTARKLSKNDEQLLSAHPEIHDLIERCRQRVLEIELQRGETPTAATSAAWSLASVWGIDTLFQLLLSLGTGGFKALNTWAYRGRDSKPATLTQLVKVSYPRPEETPAEFAARARQAVKEGTIPEKRFLELAFLAPQWAKFVEHFLAWPGFSEGLYWFLAHMRYVWGATEQAAVGAGMDEIDEDEEEAEERQRTGWERLIAERTALSDADRQDGAVDVGWFRRTYEQLTPKRWQALAEAARLSANAAQAKRAQFIADVLTGKAKRKELIDGIKKKKLKDSVRLLGLYPLAPGAKRDADLAERYKIMQEYRRYAKSLSSMTRPQAFRAIEIGMHNLANTAGYPDPLRLEWAMEADQVKDLAGGPISVSKDDVTVTLALDDQSRPQISVERAGKSLKSVPPPVKKDKRIAELLERSTELRRQASRTKQSLESAMCRGDTFTGAELGHLCGHAVLAPLLKKLILVGDNALGYPDRNGKVLRDHQGRIISIKKSDELRLAHPRDLLDAGDWHTWQHDCFHSGRVQPFKQVFRELYVVTGQEKKDGAVSHRYTGQQVGEKQAYALWGQRGWHTQDGVWKVFHDAGLTASVSFQYGFGTPLEVEGLTIEGVEFHRHDDYKPLKLKDVPPRIFSEVMRDLDLVVSVAHVGGVDPEASASTVEMRAALLRETCDLLKLKNVRIKKQHALIDGELANYSVHLGSATVHRLPGGAVCIVPVHAQHRGRLFLPFADDDPRTAEMLSKVILLARDAEIQDPTILEQLRQ